MQKPLITVVIPVGPRHEQYLETALASIDYQTIPADWIETIVIPDFDGQGAGWARNQGLALATAPLISWLDSDDYLTPTGLEALLRGYAHYDEAYTYGDWWDAWSPDNAPYRLAQAYDQQKHLRGGQHVITTLAAVADVRSIGGFDNLKGWEDWDFWCKFAIKGLCGVHINHPVIVYRITHGFRRNDSYQLKDELQAAHIARYAQYLTGELPLMACCGGDIDAKIAARNAVRLLGPIEEDHFMNEKVRMQFVGQAKGPVTWRSPITGERYRGANNGVNSFINAWPDDVQWLESLQVWRRVPRIPPSATSAPPPPVAPLIPSEDDSVDAQGSFEIPTPGRASRFPGTVVAPIPELTDAPLVVEKPAQPSRRKSKIVRDEA